MYYIRLHYVKTERIRNTKLAWCYLCCMS